MTLRGLDYDAENPDLKRPLTAKEETALRALGALTKTWPRSLKLLSMSGSLSVVFSDDERLSDDDGVMRQQAVIADVNGIPNDRGDW